MVFVAVYMYHHSRITIVQPVSLQIVLCTFWVVFVGVQNTRTTARRIYVQRCFGIERELKAKNPSAASRSVHTAHPVRQIRFYSIYTNVFLKQRSAIRGSPTLITSNANIHMYTHAYTHTLTHIHTSTQRHEKRVSPPQCFMCLS